MSALDPAPRFYECALRPVHRGRAPPAAQAAVNEAQRGAVDECLQTFGGCGCMMQHWIGELHAKVRPGRTFSGTNEMVKELAGRFT